MLIIIIIIFLFVYKLSMAEYWVNIRLICVLENLSPQDSEIETNIFVPVHIRSLDFGH